MRKKQQPRDTLVILGKEDEAFTRGYRTGRASYFSSNSKTVTWHDVVAIIKRNIVLPAEKGVLYEERLLYHAGFLIGWISGMHIPLLL